MEHKDRVRSFFGIWTVPKLLYAIGDLSLPRPVNLRSAMIFAVVAAALILTGGWPFGFISNPFVVHVGIPVGIAFLLSRPTFEGRRPDQFLLAVLKYMFRPKLSFAGSPVKPGKHRSQIKITVVRRLKVDAKE